MSALMEGGMGVTPERQLSLGVGPVVVLYSIGWHGEGTALVGRLSVCLSTLSLSNIHFSHLWTHLSHREHTYRCTMLVLPSA